MPTVDAEQKQPEPQLTYPEAELVLGLVYAAGTDYTGIQLTLENYIKRFNYRPNPIRLSEYIDKILNKINVGVPLDDGGEAARINSHMTAGNKLCEKAEDEAFLVSAAVSDISRQRKLAVPPNTQEPIPKTAHILLSLKRPEEVQLLRAVYGSGFYLIGVFASETDRLQYLTREEHPLEGCMASDGAGSG